MSVPSVDRRIAEMTVSPRPSPLRTLAPVTGLFILGIGVNLYFGARGFMPLDQSVVFDGAWRMLNGQVPFRDFAVPNGIVPSMMQVPFFRALGVTWFAYCLHASAINGLFCVIAYGLLRLLQSTVLEAAFFSALSAFFFYPPTGTPFMDQHAFFFTTLMFVTVVLGSTTSTPRTELLAWLLMPILFTLGYLSCQIPTSFTALCVAVWVACHPARAVRWVGAATCGAIAVVTCVVFLDRWWHLDWHSAVTYLITMPLQTGGARTPTPGILAPLRIALGTIRRLPMWAGLWSFDLACFAPLLLLFTDYRSDPRWRIRLWTFVSLVVTTGAFIGFSKNELEAALGLMMLVVGVALVMVRQAIAGRRGTSRLRTQVASLVFGVVAVAATRDTVVFTAHVDATRMVHETTYDGRVAAAAQRHLPKALAFLRWTNIAAYDPDQLSSLVRFLREADGDFVLIGDSSILYGLTNKVSVSAAVWLDPGLSLPSRRTPEFVEFEAELVRRLRRYNVRRIVVEQLVTTAGVTLDDFPTLKRLAESSACAEHTFGLVRVIEICARATLSERKPERKPVEPTRSTRFDITDHAVGLMGRPD